MPRLPRPRPRLAAAALAVVAATAGAALALPEHGAPRPRPALAPPPALLPAPTTSAPRPATPVTTSAPVAPPRPVPPALAALVARLDAVLANTSSCLVVDDGSSPVYVHGDATAFVPASTQKLLVAAAALDVLGPGHRFVTSVVAAAPPRGGRVDQLWLVGGGDPVLSSPEYTAYVTTQPSTANAPTTPLAGLADQLAAAGVRVVPGGIHGDDARYDRQRFLPSWRPVYVSEADVAPLGALEVDEGLDRWHPAQLTADPAAHAAGVLARLAATRGIAAGQAADATAPPGAVVLAAIASPPLADLVASMLRSSDNTTAEMLTRELDRTTGGTGSTAGGVAVVEREAAALGLPTAGLHLADGSGLSPDNRATCPTLLAALHLGTPGSRFAAIGAGLAVAGRSGTLVHRFVGSPADGALAAKTGSIAGVAGMVGALRPDRSLTFALVANGDFGYLDGTGLEDRVVGALLAYP